MRYLALATDYDGTLARDGIVDEATLDALQRLRASGRALILVTGRELDDLRSIFPRLDLFDRVVAENGALVHRPENETETTLGDPPPIPFLDALKARGVDPISVGRVIVASRTLHKDTIIDVIRDAGLDVQVITNKGALMILPAGLTKASGLALALDELGIDRSKTVAIGDAENDLALFEISGCAVAVSNALDLVKERANRVTQASHGAGVTELINNLILDDV